MKQLVCYRVGQLEEAAVGGAVAAGAAAAEAAAAAVAAAAAAAAVDGKSGSLETGSHASNSPPSGPCNIRVGDIWIKNIDNHLLFVIEILLPSELSEITMFAVNFEEIESVISSCMLIYMF